MIEDLIYHILCNCGFSRLLTSNQWTADHNRQVLHCDGSAVENKDDLWRLDIGVVCHNVRTADKLTTLKKNQSVKNFFLNKRALLLIEKYKEISDMTTHNKITNFASQVWREESHLVRVNLWSAVIQVEDFHRCGVSNSNSSTKNEGVSTQWLHNDLVGRLDRNWATRSAHSVVDVNGWWTTGIGCSKIALSHHKEVGRAGNKSNLLQTRRTHCNNN